MNSPYTIIQSFWLTDLVLPVINYHIEARLFIKKRFHYIISRPGQSQGLLYKHHCHSFIDSVSEPFPPTALRRRHAQTVRVSTSSYKIEYG